MTQPEQDQSRQPRGQRPQERPSDDPEPEWKRRRRLAQIFGDVLPETTDDERDAADRTERDDSASDAWLKSQVPPHHGG